MRRNSRPVNDRNIPVNGGFGTFTAEEEMEWKSSNTKQKTGHSCIVNCYLRDKQNQRIEEVEDRPRINMKPSNIVQIFALSRWCLKAKKILNS